MKCIKFVSTWCNDNFLDLNVSKTKEMIWDYWRSPTEKHPVVINDKPVEVTSVYKYLGLLIDNKFSFTQHVDTQIKKANKRLYCIRSMKKLNVHTDLIAMFFNATVPPVLMYACTAFYGMLRVSDMNLTGLRKHVIDCCNVILLRIMVHCIRTK